MRNFALLFLSIFLALSSSVMAHPHILRVGGRYDIPLTFAMQEGTSFVNSERTIFFNFTVEELLGTQPDLLYQDAKDAFVRSELRKRKSKLPSYQHADTSFLEDFPYPNIVFTGKYYNKRLGNSVHRSYVFFVDGKMYWMNCVCTRDAYFQKNAKDTFDSIFCTFRK